MNFDWRSLLGASSGKPGSAIPIRSSGKTQAVILIHGFTGEALGSWEGFYQCLCNDPNLDDWDIYALSYPSTHSVDKWAWLRGDPSISVLAANLLTTLTLPPFDTYARLAIAAHSMGGLFVQRALLDNAAVTARVSHLALYGTPSLGLLPSKIISAFKKQAADMAPHSSFIKTLRKDWADQFGNNDPPFRFMTVAGNVDEFVPGSSSLEPFPARFRRVVAGDHGTIIRPAESRQGVDLMRAFLVGPLPTISLGERARLELENGQFQSAVDILLPNVAQIDEAALSDLALALDGLHRENLAIQILEEHYKNGTLKSSEAKGVLAGRLKRRWLVERRRADLEGETDLYTKGYTDAAATDDSRQAYYHAINLAFLALMSAPLNSKLPDDTKHWAELALFHCARAPFDNWRVATEAEAHLVLGELEQSYKLYAEAVSATRSPRQLGSMYSQASRIADRLHGDASLSKIKEIFDRYRD